MDRVRILHIDGPASADALCVDFAAGTYYHVPNGNQLQWLKDNFRIEELGGLQAPWIIEGFEKRNSAQ